MTENTKDIEGVLAEIAKQETKGNERVKATGEVFTPMPLVKRILSDFPIEKFKDPQSTLLDPSCGDGNFLVELVNILSQYHDRDHVLDHMVYGIDIMPDNIHTARTRLGLTPDRNGWHHIVCADYLAYDISSFDTHRDLEVSKLRSVKELFSGTTEDLPAKQEIDLERVPRSIENIDWTDRKLDVSFRQGDVIFNVEKEFLFEGKTPSFQDTLAFLAETLGNEAKGVIEICGENPEVIAFWLLLSEVPPNGITFEVRRGSKVLLENPVSDPNDDGDDPS